MQKGTFGFQVSTLMTPVFAMYKTDTRISVSSSMETAVTDSASTKKN
jgi:hypothetical protein